MQKQELLKQQEIKILVYLCNETRSFVFLKIFLSSIYKMSETENKEEFCPVCAVVPLAMAGAGMAGIGSTKDPKKNKKSRIIMLIVGIILTLVSLLIGLFYWKRCTDCR
jgi:hypothetical protein